VVELKEKILKALIEGESVAIKYRDVKKYANLKTGHEVIFLGHVKQKKRQYTTNTPQMKS